MKLEEQRSSLNKKISKPIPMNNSRYENEARGGMG